MADWDGIAHLETSDSLAGLYGDDSIVGRAMVVHAGEDDLGLGGDSGSRASGNAGARVACCIIGLTDEP